MSTIFENLNGYYVHWNKLDGDNKYVLFDSLDDLNDHFTSLLNRYTSWDRNTYHMIVEEMIIMVYINGECQKDYSKYLMEKYIYMPYNPICLEDDEESDEEDDEESVWTWVDEN